MLSQTILLIWLKVKNFCTYPRGADKKMSSDVAQKRISGKSLAVNRGIWEPRIVEKVKYISGKDFFKSEYNCIENEVT